MKARKSLLKWECEPSSTYSRRYSCHRYVGFGVVCLCGVFFRSMLDICVYCSGQVYIVLDMPTCACYTGVSPKQSKKAGLFGEVQVNVGLLNTFVRQLCFISYL